MKSIKDVAPSALKGKRVFLRAGLDEPLEHGEVKDAFRLKRAAETILYLQKMGARVVVASHLGRNMESMAPVARALQAYASVTFIPDIVGMHARDAAEAMRDGDAILLENLRRDSREAENDEGFARSLAALAEVYVGDAFSVAHRAHTSIVGVPKFLPAYAGIVMCEEIEGLSPARTPPSPSLAIIGGAKFDTKEPLIKALLTSYDHVFVGGALVNDVFKSLGLPVGRSVVSESYPPPEVISHPKLLLPADVTVELLDGQARVKKPEEVKEDDKIVDIGPESLKELAAHINQAKLVLWNGPTGLYEDGFLHWTTAIAEIIAGSSAHSIIGGNNTLTCIRTANIPEERFGFLSTGGGAMLEYLLAGTLPGIEALNLHMASS